MEQQYAIDLREVLLRLKSYVLRVLVLALLAAVAAWGGTRFLMTPIYEADTRLFVLPNYNLEEPTGTETKRYFRESKEYQATQQVMLNIEQLLTGDEVLQGISDELALGLTPAQLRGQLAVRVEEGSDAIRISCTDPDPARAEQLADAVAAVAPQVVAGIADTHLVLVRQEISAAGQAYPISAGAARNAVLAGVGAFVLLMGLVLFQLLLGGRFQTLQDVQRGLQLPLLGVLPEAASSGCQRLFGKRPACGFDLLAPGAAPLRREAYTSLRTALKYQAEEGGCRRLLVAEPVPGEGAAEVCANLALSLAQTGARVLLVDGDLRRGPLCALLGLPPAEEGLAQVLAGRLPAEAAIRPVGDTGVELLAAGRAPANPVELLDSAAMRELSSRLAGQYGYLLFNAPAVDVAADAAALSRSADAALLVVRQNSVTLDQAAQARTTLQEMGAKLAGVVVNQVPASAIDKNSGYYSSCVYHKQ